eukprot:269287-Pyramimonas_sp.AAC.2
MSCETTRPHFATQLGFGQHNPRKHLLFCEMLRSGFRGSSLNALCSSERFRIVRKDCVCTESDNVSEVAVREGRSRLY